MAEQSRGFDFVIIDEPHHSLNGDPTRSDVTAQQMLGRTLRPGDLAAANVVIGFTATPDFDPAAVLDGTTYELTTGEAVDAGLISPVATALQQEGGV